jgi:hypothetical protein
VATALSGHGAELVSRPISATRDHTDPNASGRRSGHRTVARPVVPKRIGNGSCSSDSGTAASTTPRVESITSYDRSDPETSCTGGDFKRMHLLRLICSLIIQVGKFQSVILRKFRPVLTVRAPNLMWLLGAGASASAGIPTASSLIWQFKRTLFCTRQRISAKSCEDLSVKLNKRTKTARGWCVRLWPV